MVQSPARTVAAYLASLPADRRSALETVRVAILGALDEEYEEGMQYGMIGYYVPRRVFPAGYHTDPKQPLPFAALAAQKNYNALYLMGVYCGCGTGSTGETPDARWFREAWTRTGKKLDMGRACVRFKAASDVPLDVVAEAIRRIPARVYVERYTATLGERAKPRAKRGASAPAQARVSRRSVSGATGRGSGKR